LAAIIIPGQSDTYRHLQARVTGLLTESGQMVDVVGKVRQPQTLRLAAQKRPE